MIRVQSRTPHRKIHITNGPPPPTSSETAAAGLKSRCNADTMTLPFDALGQQAGALFVESLDDLTRQRRETGVDEKQRNRDAQAEDRRDHRLPDAVSH